MNPLLRRLAEHTEPAPEVIDRLRAAVAPPSAGPALRALRGPDDGALVARLRARKIGGGRPGGLTGGAVLAGLLAVGAGGWLLGGIREEASGVQEWEGAPAGEVVPGRARGSNSAADSPSDRPGRSLSPGSASPVPAPGRAGAAASGAGPIVPVFTTPSAASAEAVITSRYPPEQAVEDRRPISPSLGGAGDGPISAGPGRAPPDPSGRRAAPSTAPALDSASASPSSGSSAPFAPSPLPGQSRPSPPPGVVEVVTWEVGTFEGGAASPDELIVQTREATVRVLDGQVAVTRDRLGTHIHGVSGTVFVRCGTGAERALVSDTLCLPVSAAAWLGRALALQAAGAPNGEVLVAVEAGLAFGPEESAYGELIELQVAGLRAAGRYAEAREAARRYPKDGPRAAEMER